MRDIPAWSGDRPEDPLYDPNKFTKDDWNSAGCCLGVVVAWYALDASVEPDYQSQSLNLPRRRTPSFLHEVDQDPTSSSSMPAARHQTLFSKRKDPLPRQNHMIENMNPHELSDLHQPIRRRHIVAARLRVA